MIRADGRSLSYVTAEVVDREGVMVPDADNPITYDVTGGTLAGLDNGRQEDAEGYRGTTHTAFNGKGLAIVQSHPTPGSIRVTASSPGLRPVTTTIRARGGGRGASGWSNAYVKAATALLPAFSVAHASDWVSVSWPSAQRLDAVDAFFTVDATHALPAATAVSAWNGTRFVPVGHARVDWAAASDQPTRITFDPVRTTRIRLELTSRAPRTDHGFLQIAELQFPGAR